MNSFFPDDFMGWCQAIGILAAAIAALGIPAAIAAGRKRREDIFTLMLRVMRKIGQLAFANAEHSISGNGKGHLETAVEDYTGVMDELNGYLDKRAFHK